MTTFYDGWTGPQLMLEYLRLQAMLGRVNDGIDTLLDTEATPAARRRWQARWDRLGTLGRAIMLRDTEILERLGQHVP